MLSSSNGSLSHAQRSRSKITSAPTSRLRSTLTQPGMICRPQARLTNARAGSAESFREVGCIRSGKTSRPHVPRPSGSDEA